MTAKTPERPPRGATVTVWEEIGNHDLCRPPIRGSLEITWHLGDEENALRALDEAYQRAREEIAAGMKSEAGA